MSGPGNWVAIPHHIIRDASFPGSALRVYGLILSYAWGENPCIASTETLCEQAGVKRSAFFDATRFLRERGLIRVEKRPGRNGQVNAYFPVQTGGVATPETESENRTESEKQPASRPAERTPSRPANRTQKKTKEEEENCGGGSAGAGALPEVFAALENAGFDRLTIEQHASAIGLAIAETNPPPDTDWHLVGVKMERGRRSGDIKSPRPDGALKFVLKGLDGIPRVGQPAPYLFGDRPLTKQQAAQRRDEIRIARMRGEAA